MAGKLTPFANLDKSGKQSIAPLMTVICPPLSTNYSFSTKSSMALKRTLKELACKCTSQKMTSRPSWRSLTTVDTNTNEFLKPNDGDGAKYVNFSLILSDDPDHHCDNCGKILKRQSFTDDGEYQFKNNLVIGFFGGYGMYGDDFDGQADPLVPGAMGSVNYCKKRADKILKSFPSMKKALNNK